MSERKAARETWESFTERKIREAQSEGAFDALPGMGQPIPGIEKPLDENWWVRDKLRREELTVLPPILEARLEVEKTLETIRSMSSKSAVRKRLEQLNEKIRKAHYSHIAGPADGIAPLDIAATLKDWEKFRRSRRQDE